MGDLDRLLAHFEPDRPATLIGHSMGGNIASMYAGVRPERVSHLVNLEGFGMSRSEPAKAPARYAKWLAERIGLTGTLVAFPLKGDLILATHGGEGGGGAELTETGRQILALYRELETKTSAATRATSKKILSQLEL